ncbi:MAG: RelA/SpoT family protein [Bacteroidetes bacterium]|nr:RelA/SpoT family protein [Bacteroidota bacterium]
MQIADPELEKKQLLKEYRNLLKACKETIVKKDKKLIRDAFTLALEAHQGMRRKSGELYIFHPLSVATICASEIGMGTTSIICALLHDVVEDTDITLEDIEAKFGKKVSNIIDGLTKISGVVGKTNSIQAENFRKILLTLADDVRVIIIKLADRLHNMRTLDSMSRTTQLKIASETLVLFAPLAHRLGLYNIKNELEDLTLKYTEPKVYKEISQKLQDTKAQRNKFIKKFIAPIEQKLKEEHFDIEIKGRPKSIFSIYLKMKKQGIPFEEVYDLFAVRIITESPIEIEKADCWRIYSIITDFYKPNPDRLRDWISFPKSNGYESLHTTIMGPEGNWVEVQIRSTRMDEIAERGYAAHWKYKEGQSNADKSVEDWLNRIRETLENPEANAIDFLDDFKLNLFDEEVYVFTPKGDLFNMPSKATALDFAFEIHTQVGLQCLGAKVNHKLVPLSHELKTGDQVEIITSKKQKPTESWLKYVITPKAKNNIKTALKDEKRKVALDGKEILQRKFKSSGVIWNNQSLSKLVNYFKLPSQSDLFFNVGAEKIEKTELNAAFKFIESAAKLTVKTTGKTTLALTAQGKVIDKPDLVIVGENTDLEYSFARCCNPIPGDDIFGFVTIHEGIKIHRTNCPNGIRLMSNYGYRILRCKWATNQLQETKTFQAGIKIVGIDGVGIVSKIADIVSKEQKLNMQSITVSAVAGAFEGAIILNIHDTEHLEQLIQKIRAIQGIDSVMRFDIEL